MKILNEYLKSKRAFILVIGFFSSLLLRVELLKAEPLQDAFRYGTYGLVAGAIAGGASMAFSEDPGSKLSPVAKGASLGLYAGLFVAFYKNLDQDPQEHQFDIYPIGYKTSDQKESLGLLIQTHF